MQEAVTLLSNKADVQLLLGRWRGTLALEENPPLLQLLISTSDMDAIRPNSQYWSSHAHEHYNLSCLRLRAGMIGGFVMYDSW